jgi:excisionase family DNA binding protein
VIETPFLTPEEAAQYLRLHPDTMYRLLQRGDLPALKVGRQWRVRRSDLDAYLRGEAPGADAKRPQQPS